MRLPGGPGIHIDTGIEEGETISGAFDSMVAKLIVTGKNRKEALQRSHRALTEMRIAGLATVLPFHRRVIQDPNFAPELDQPGQKLPADGPFTVHTRSIETDFINDLQPQVTSPAMDADDSNSNVASSRLKSTVNALKSRCRIHCLASQRLSPNRSVVVRHAAPPEQAERVRLVFPETWLPHQCRALS